MNNHVNGKNTSRRTSERSGDKGAFVIIISILLGLGVLFLGSIFFPDAFRVIFTLIWVILFSVVVIFIGLGTLTLLGLRKEVTHTLELMVEGSLSILDFISFLKKIINQFLSKLKQFLLFIAPTISFSLAFLIYLGMLILYKYVGRDYDVTLLTIVLTVVSVVAASYLTRPKEVQETSLMWIQEFLKKISESFADSFEVVIFIFFLTMDSHNLFFLPKALNVPISAEVGGYNLMVRGFSTNEVLITVSIVIIAIFLEIIRNVMRITTTTVTQYNQLIKQPEYFSRYGRAELIKISVRDSFNEAKDDLVKFIAFTTVLLGVFLLFPRLKLVAMATASFAALVMDVALPSRMTAKKGNDLISRIFDKIFKFNY